jgi:glycosyltransferase involved in cell wall biosynthesis
MASKPVPVLLVTRELDQGGVERDVAKIASYLDRKRFTPHVAAFYAHGMRYQDLVASGVPILSLPLRSLLSRTAVSCALQMRRYIRKHGIRIVHSYDASGAFALPVARLSRVPVTIGSQLSYRDLLDQRTQSLSRFSDHVADAVLVNCEALRKYMVEQEHVAPGRVEICYNGVETAKFYPNPAPRPAPVADASAVIGTICALRAEKGLPWLQEAFARVLSHVPGMKLLIVGSGVELAGLQERASRLGIAHATVFIPATAAVAEWLNAIDIFVLPSKSEGFSNALLEAMACGCAVIGSRVGGTPELTGQNGEHGLLFESGNVDELTEKILCLAKDVMFRKDLGRRAACFARESLSIEIAAARTADIYDKWLARKNAAGGA